MDVKIEKKNCSLNPTILEPRNVTIDLSELHKTRQPVDFEVLKFEMVGQVKSGLLLNHAYLECCFCYRHVSFSDFKRFRRRMKHYVRGLLGFL